MDRYPDAPARIELLIDLTIWVAQASHSLACNRMHPRLQPCVPEAAAEFTRGCSRIHPRLQPYYPRLQASVPGGFFSQP